MKIKDFSKKKNIEDRPENQSGLHFENPLEHSKKYRIFKIIKRTLLIFLALIIIVGGFTTFVVLRNRQLCLYQNEIDNGNVISDGTLNLCPNLLDLSQIGTVVSNAFNFGITNNLYLNSDFDILAFVQKDIEKCTDPLNPICWLTGTRPEIAQTEDGYTNFLAIGLDTRNNSALNNTDSILLITLDHNTNTLLFTSFPRDMYLDYIRPNGLAVAYKINAVYAIDGVEGLNGVISQVVDQPIHYYAYINPDIFTDAIDSFGEIKIDLEEPFADLYPCSEVPNEIYCEGGFYGYGYYTFPQGENFFDSFESLVYTRSRLLSSDFDRARRQQNLIRAVIQNVIEDESSITEKFSLYLNLYNIFRERVITNVTPKDFSGLFSLVNSVNDTSGQMVLDPALNNFSLISNLGIIEGLGYSIGFNDTTYTQFREYRQLALDHLPLYAEKPNVRILVSTSSTQNLDRISQLSFLNEEFGIFEIINTEEVFSGVRIYDLSGGQNNKSLKFLQSNIPNSLIFNASLDGVSVEDEDIDILIEFGN